MPKRFRKNFITYKSKKDYFFNFFFFKLKKLFLDKNEKLFFEQKINLNKSRNKILGNKKIVILQMMPHHYYLLHFHFILKDKRFEDMQIVGLWTNLVFHKPGPFSFLVFIWDTVYNYFLKRKWYKLYKKIGVKHYFDLNDNNIKSNFLNCSHKFFNRYFQNLSRENIKKIKYKKINIGNEVYDTFLRYYGRCSIYTKDLPIIYKIMNISKYSYESLDYYYKKNKNKIAYYFTSDHSYIQSGLASKYFISKNVKVIGGTNTNSYLNFYNKFPHGRQYENYYKIFQKLQNKKKKINISKKFILKSNSKFLLRKHPKNNLPIKKINKKIDVVIFLPDFVDSPHSQGWLVFSDFAEWIESTLSYFEKKKLNVAVKPHPSSRYASLVYESYLKRKFKKKIIWLSSSQNNSEIFKTDLLFGISPVGSITYGLALNKKIVINIGRNPFMSFKYSYCAKNKKDYFNLIEKGIKGKLKVDKINENRILSSIYMFFLYQYDYFPVLSRKIKLFEYNDHNSNILKKVIDKKLLNI